MKGILAALMSSLFIICFMFASGVPARADGEKLNVVTTIFPQYDFVREIAGDKAELTMLLRPGAESHSFDPTPRDIKKIAAADIFIYVGGESDDWARRILDSLTPDAREKIRIVSLMDLVDTVEEELVEGMREEAEENGEKSSDESEYDEHVWTSPKNARRITSELMEIICGLDKPNETFYRANAAGYMEKLDELDRTFEDIVGGAKRRTIIFGDRFPFRYFVDAYGLDYYAAFPGCSTETEASAATLAFLINKVKAENIPVVFYREFSNENMANAICENTGAKSLLLHSCHNITRDEFEGGRTYLELMAQNALNLREALN